ncbi:FUSC family protein [Cryobacterium sp. SO2]|uniref:FUSC family protein n=1 Tax=Cryobacterium sp. SO2 TaxID=1897060 RepID=UPI00223C959F|nr:FUSC family protein [Cryobacterium sp. SO2]WEO76965.1 FUSC family protein [Cryobacterium sp. SO2]
MPSADLSLRKTGGQLKTFVWQPRLLQAVKTAVAVAIAWKLAPLMPGVADAYPYYAPLGVIVASFPTLMGSITNAVQTLAGLVIGICLAAAVIIFSEPSLLTVSLVVGIGILFGGIRQLGAGREYVPIAGLFVLIVGGPNADGYSIGYVSQMTLGIVVGLAVNLLVAPPLRVTAAVKELSGLRGALGLHLGSLADALDASWPPAEGEWSTQGQTLAGTTAAVRRTLADADESRRINPRARIRPHDLRTDYDDLAALENVTFYVRDLTDVLAGAAWGTPVPVELPDLLRPPLCAAARATAAVVTEWDTGSTSLATLQTAEDAVAAVTQAIHDHRELGAEAIVAASAATLDLTRMLAALRPGIVRDAPAPA